MANLEIIKCTVLWIKAHPNHFVESEVDVPLEGTPSWLWCQFLSNPRIINEYEHPEDNDMEEDEVINGCSHVFNHGAYRSTRCNRPLLAVSKCYFHSAFIFSDELRQYITIFKHNIDRFANSDQ